MVHAERVAPGVYVTRFSTPRGAQECFLTVTSERGSPFSDALAQLDQGYIRALSATGLSDETIVFSRIYSGDVVNQAPRVRESPLFARLAAGAVSVVGQPCLDGGTVCLFSYHVQKQDGGFARQRSAGGDAGRNSLLLSMRNYALLCNAEFCGSGALDSYRQTREIFEALGARIGDTGMTLATNAIRTWVYVRDVDNHYKGMVTARREFFAAHDLNEKTRYLASTGIEGRSESVSSLVTVDALSIGGLRPDQILRMDALDHMPRTIDYGVTFERGLRVRFGDRSHLYVSGTASIDAQGKIMHPGDVRGQTERTLENLSALLGTPGAALDDLMYLFVYVRDFHDLEVVRSVLAGRIREDLPVLSLHAAVCRPGWLVEMEGVAIVPDEAGYPVFR